MKVLELNSLSCPEAAPYSRLTEAQLVRAGEGKGLFIAESPNVIKAALEAGYAPVSVLTEAKHIPSIERELGEALGEAPVLTAPPSELEKLTGFRLSRGVLCAMERKPLSSLSEVLDNAKRIAVLEGVGDPTNVGAIMRSAAALGMDAVLLCGNCCDPLHRRAARVSMGAVFRIPWAILPCRADDANAAELSLLHGRGYFTAAAALDGRALPAFDPSFGAEEKLAILLGSEGDGLSKRTVEDASGLITIPMAHGMDSLNVAAAAAVLFWELAEKPRRML